MNIVYISEFDVAGSGYSNISTLTCDLLTKMGHKVTALGIGYKGEEHNFPYTIVPVSKNGFFNYLEGMVHNLKADKENVMERLFIALDIPMQIHLLSRIKKYEIPTIGIFPLEAPPLTFTWAASLSSLRMCMVMNHFGVKEVQANGLKATYFPMMLNTEAWRIPTEEERTKIRTTMGVANKKVVLCVADNQERKNLSATLEIIKRTPEAVLYLVTRRDTGVGWELDDLVMEMQLQNRVMMFERGLPFKNLWMLYACADAFLITSKAEGLGMPVLEAMACGVPVVAPNHTSFAEHLADDRGFLFDWAHCYRDPFGNEFRYFADIDKGAEALQRALKVREHAIPMSARQYVLDRTQDNFVEALNVALS